MNNFFSKFAEEQVMVNRTSGNECHVLLHSPQFALLDTTVDVERYGELEQVLSKSVTLNVAKRFRLGL